MSRDYLASMKKVSVHEDRKEETGLRNKNTTVMMVKDSHGKSIERMIYLRQC